MPEYPVIICLAKRVQGKWKNVPPRLRDGLLASLHEKMRQEKPEGTVCNWIERQISVPDNDGGISLFSVVMSVQEKKVDMDAHQRLLQKGFDQKYLNKFPPPRNWHVYTLMYEPTPV